VDRPLVSIVVPSLNQAAFLEEALRSLLEQDYQPLEVLVVDGGSTDGSAEIIRRWEERLAWWVSEPDRGQADALNKGLARARGSLLGWLSSDDALLPGALERLVEPFLREPELLLAYGDAVFTDERGARGGALRARPFDVAQMVRSCECHIVQPASLFSRRAWELAGPFDPSRHWFFDFELFVRLGLAGRAEQLDGEPLATYRLHSGSKSVGQSLPKARDYMRVAREFYGDGFFSGRLAGLAREARASAYHHGGIYFYDALALGEARRCFLRALALDPRRAPRELALVARTLVPAPVVSRVRARRETASLRPDAA
jgi:glycosyltransferase involved in cell wall biosynthesis